ncbi:4-hydroxythreonine-4-phosphate dehydrogenase [Cohnella kolymensis]|uniref:4-hydroxythreonine-4-phosphate dehydrogenase n=2 Tax=Cohnella kolymensis TaxID=1590652 RepID=A0ABR5A4U1_9BACL|nr:4-hydroxythreonine-4-phosphate dehydrogenase PdxA [Cohnella kolymensis]KIL35457.1 4-hydroxythreonine-4-phosphate dehydrogenase [Cohnella kolymensis]
MNTLTKPTIGITMGDAAGVGPEIIAKTLQQASFYERCHPVVIGDAKIMERAMSLVGSPQRLRKLTDPSETEGDPKQLDIIDVDLLPADLPFGEISAKAGDAAFQFIKRAVEFAQEGKIQGICTAPLNKEALHKGGHLFPGHTEILAELTGTSEFAMMLTAPKLRVIHVTTHIGLVDAIAKINPKRVHTVILLADETLKRAGIPKPRIGVCGINPHAGEHGLFGHGEEEEKIIPAVERAQSEGIIAEGPLPADTLFFRATRGDFDIVVAMYHDQGHGPIKVMGLEAGVNITVGLPIIRTSVDHGTAFDIAGTGKADPGSLEEALRQAIELAPKGNS